MPEGHTIHAAARAHGLILAGNVIGVSSPQGRFRSGAARLNGQTCVSVEAYGKNLLYRFGKEKVLRVHLGLFGRIRSYNSSFFEARDTVRVRFSEKSNVIDITGPTICKLLRKAEVQNLINRIGPDPLRDDADPERVFSRISKSRASIGKLIMDQSIISGIGNIYRTELLWRQSIHPNISGRSLLRFQLEGLWYDAKYLLRIGAKRNSIITSDAAIQNGKKLQESVNIFGKSSCPKCSGNVNQIAINGRKVFVCDVCQPFI